MKGDPDAIQDGTDTGITDTEEQEVDRYEVLSRDGEGVVVKDSAMILSMNGVEGE